MRAPPAWALPEELVYHWTLPFSTPSQGALAKMRADEYKRLREKFLAHLRGAAPPAAPLPRAGLVVVRRGARVLHWDNAYGGLRPLLDCLVARDAQHPYGLGYMLDDSPTSGMPYPPAMQQDKSAADAEQTEVFLYRIR